VRVIGWTVPFLAADRARTEVDLLVWRKSLVDILDLRHRCLVEELVVGKIEAVKVAILW
jgi:hypothetical protein